MKAWFISRTPTIKFFVFQMLSIRAGTFTRLSSWKHSPS
jgi:hypothetical protein